MAEAARTLVHDVRHEAEEPAPRADVNVRGIALTIVAVTASMWVLQWASEVFIPIVLSILISYALEPIVEGLIRLRLPRMAASALVVASLTGILGYTAYALSDDAAAIVALGLWLSRVLGRGRNP